MPFDFTQEVPLEKKNYKIYKVFQILLYLASFVFALFLLFSLFFPTGYFVFSFPNFNSTKNTLRDPRNDQNNILEKGQVKSGESMIFDASIVGSYSEMSASFDLGKKSAEMNDGKIEIRKSYRAFLLPKGDPIGFQDGSLIENGNNFYIVSEGKLRMFENKNIALSMGFSEAGFIKISPDELSSNSKGDLISIKDGYPQSSLFKIKNYFYMLSGGQLNKFVSTSAYLSRFNENQAVIKDEKFLENYKISENLLGFSEGSLIAYGNAAFVVSGKEILPIGDPTIFAASGFSWNDLINVSSDEASLYVRGKIFALDSVHPDGTIFFSSDSGKFYIIKDGKKHLLSGEKAVASWNKRAPIEVSEKSLNISDSCDFQKKTFDFGTASYTCKVSIENIANLPGKDYELKIIPENNIDINQIDISFKKTVSQQGFRQSILNILGKIKGNYVKE
jgi:hypothetical protein